jgi:hypothetical protein
VWALVWIHRDDCAAHEFSKEAANCGRGSLARLRRRLEEDYDQLFARFLFGALRMLSTRKPPAFQPLPLAQIFRLIDDAVICDVVKVVNSKLRKHLFLCLEQPIHHCDRTSQPIHALAFDKMNSDKKAWASSTMLADDHIFIDMPQELEELLGLLGDTRTKRIKTLLNAPNETGEGVLMLAASQGLENIVRCLLEIGADPNVTNASGQTALDAATDAGFFSVSQSLVNAGADTAKSHVFQKIFSNEREYAGEMRRATTHHNLLEAKIDPSELSQLSRAAFAGNIDSASALLASNTSGASLHDIEEGAGSGYTALHLVSHGFPCGSHGPAFKGRI